MSNQLINTTDNLPTGRTKITDNYAELYNYRAWNAVGPPNGYTALAGDSNYTNASGTDDATALQALIDGAIASGGNACIELPNKRTYKIASTITIPFGITIRGVGTRTDANTGAPTYIVWGGSAGGTMFDVVVTTSNIPAVVFENLALAGRGDGTNLPGKAIRFRATGGAAGAIDTGTILRHVNITKCATPISIEGGATNFVIDGGRIDNWTGYGIHADLNGASGAGTGLSMTITGNWTAAGGATCDGVMYLDAETGTTQAISDVKLIGPHIEIGELNSTYSGGSNPYDKAGIFRLGVKASQGAQQHRITVIGMRLDAAFSLASHSVFQITASSTADSDLDNTRMVNIQVIGGVGLSRGTTEAATDDEIRIVGGRVHANYRPPYTASGNIGTYHLNIGKNAAADIGWSHMASLRYYMRHPIIQPMTVAQLDTSWPTDGMFGYVTDASSPTAGANVSGGGAVHCLVMYSTQGTDGWKVVQVFS